MGGCLGACGGEWPRGGLAVAANGRWWLRVVGEVGTGAMGGGGVKFEGMAIVGGGLRVARRGGKWVAGRERGHGCEGKRWRHSEGEGREEGLVDESEACVSGGGTEGLMEERSEEGRVSE
ncbi:unnamed protein product [Sphenostylis stenocarpa]|uniref:Uncharacterized protein n=1 Tax=Sphenostylis stenocarpa TaxID=92480 RepID=A0AA86S257_9FABA|nr:unnamed protein product [Sphenostylis stenocarpa]